MKSETQAFEGIRISKVKAGAVLMIACGKGYTRMYRSRVNHDFDLRIVPETCTIWERMVNGIRFRFLTRL